MAIKARSVVSQPKSVLVAMVIAVVGGLIFIAPYFGTVMVAALIAFIFNPVYKATFKRTNKSSLALLITFTVIVLSFIVPLTLIISVTAAQANTLVTKLQAGTADVGPAQIEASLEQGTERINGLLRAVPGGENFDVDKQEITETIKNIAADFAKGVANFIREAGTAIIGSISTFILSFFLIMAFLRHQTELVAFLKSISPFEDEITTKYLDRSGAMTKAMVIGQLIIALFQGFASTFSLWLVGVDYFGFFFMLLTFLSFIPLGAGILTIPIGLVIMLAGNVGQGLFVILFHVIVVTNIDNILRPRLVPKQVRLDPALILLGVFSGIAIFGAIGVIYGPVIIILLTTTFEMYAKNTRQSA